MIAFIAIATLMVVIALGWLLWPLLRTPGHAAVERHAANANIYRDQFADLDADLARGTISEPQYREARAELERRLLDEARADRAAPAQAAHSGKASAVALVVAIPVVAGLLYWKLGAPDAFTPLATTPESAHQLSQDQIEEMVARLAERLKKEPDNIDGWVVLARSYYTMRRFPEAASAYEKVALLVPDEPDVLTDYADALAMAHDRNLTGRPSELVQRALKLNPTHWKALAMAGTAAFDQKDYKQAVAYWETLRSSQPPDSPIAQAIGRSIDEARQLGNLPPSAVAAASPKSAPASPAKSMAQAAPKGASTVSGVISLSEAIKAKAAPSDTVYIFARPAEGSRMPLALTQVRVSELPAKFTLDDSMAMSQDMKLSSAASVIVGARVSKTGRPMPSSGDLEGLSKPVSVGAKDVAVTIDRILP